MDGPTVLDLIRRWDGAFAWEPARDRGAVIHDGQGRMIETSAWQSFSNAPE